MQNKLFVSICPVCRYMCVQFEVSITNISGVSDINVVKDKKKARK